MGIVTAEMVARRMTPKDSGPEGLEYLCRWVTSGLVTTEEAVIALLSKAYEMGANDAAKAFQG